MATLTFKLVNDDNGSIDRSASLEAAEEVLDKHLATREMEESKVSAAVNAVLDELKAAGTKANLEYVISASLNKLNVAAMPQMYSTLKEQVGSYIRSNSQGKITNKETGTVERPNSLFVIGRGVGSSTQRRADLAPAS